jgi:chromosome segregation ATPase
MEEVKTIEAQVQRLNAENIDIKRRLDNLESNDRRHEEDIRELYKAQEGTKVYVTQILGSIQQLETKLFGLVSQLTNNQEKDRKAERNERSKTQQHFIDFSKFVVAATVGAVVLYLFQNGGGK